MQILPPPLPQLESALLNYPGSRLFNCTHLQDNFPLESMRLNQQHRMSLPSTEHTSEFTAYCFMGDDWITEALQCSCSFWCPTTCGPEKFPLTFTEALTSIQNSSWCQDSKALRKNALNKSSEQKWKFGACKSSIIILKWLPQWIHPHPPPTSNRIENGEYHGNTLKGNWTAICSKREK